MKKIFMKTLYRLLLNKIYNPFFGTNIKPMEFIPKENEKYLVIAPHPDDESIGCGGLLSMYPKFFDVVCLTHGDDSDIRKQEMQKAMALAEINNLKMLNLRDKNIINGQKEFDTIDISSYDIIFIPYIFDQHKDHKAVSLLLSNKLKHSEYKSNLNIAYYEVWSTINMPQYYVDISKVIDMKKQIINCHQSQTISKNYADKIIGLNSYRGLLKNLDAVEAFSFMRVKDFQKIIQKMIFE